MEEAPPSLPQATPMALSSTLLQEDVEVEPQVPVILVGGVEV